MQNCCRVPTSTTILLLVPHPHLLDLHRPPPIWKPWGEWQIIHHRICAFTLAICALPATWRRLLCPCQTYKATVWARTKVTWRPQSVGRLGACTQIVDLCSTRGFTGAVVPMPMIQCHTTITGHQHTTGCLYSHTCWSTLCLRPDEDCCFARAHHAMFQGNRLIVPAGTFWSETCSHISSHTRFLASRASDTSATYFQYKHGTSSSNVEQRHPNTCGLKKLQRNPNLVPQVHATETKVNVSARQCPAKTHYNSWSKTQYNYWTNTCTPPSLIIIVHTQNTCMSQTVAAFTDVVAFAEEALWPSSPYWCIRFTVLWPSSL
jgi:hypothetical protein